MRSMFSLLSGGLFGLGLLISGMTDTTKVQGWLDIFGAWDATLAFVLGGAILPMFVAWRVAARRSAPLAGGAFPVPASGAFSRSLAVGSVLFGAGWGLAGLCPGPSLASLTFGGWQGVAFLAAMIAGFWTAVPARRMNLLPGKTAARGASSSL